MTAADIVRAEPPLRIEKGCEVLLDGKRWVVVKHNGLAQVQVRCLEGAFRESRVVDVGLLRAPTADDPPSRETDILIDEVSDEDWDVAKERLTAIAPLLGNGRGKVKAAREAAERIGVHLDTLYKWCNAYLETEKLSALLPRKRPGGKGKGRVPAAVEKIIDEAITLVHETGAESTLASLQEDIVASCKVQGLRPPHLKTVRLRVAWRDQENLIAKRKGKKAARQRFSPVNTNPDEALHPLHKTQIDHAVVDVIIVHEVTRQPLYRPWLTLIIDMYSRVVLGYYLSLDHPSSTSVGACIAHAICPKEKHLRRLGATFNWPVWGVMQIVRADNGADFRGSRLAPSFKEYVIERQFRPVKKPHYGAHIERLIGTFAKRFRILPGATTNKPKKDADYSAEATAAMTMEELEKWLVEEINKYHHTPHSGLEQEAPLACYERAFLQPDSNRPLPLPARRTDEDRVAIDFLPEVKRVISRDGIGIDGRRYWSDVLAPWLGYRRPGSDDNPMFRFKTDDRDISRIFFWDEEQNVWFRIPSAYTGAIDASRAEYRNTRKAIKKQTGENPSERAVHDSVLRQREISKKAIADSELAKKAARSKSVPTPKRQELKKDQQVRDSERRSVERPEPDQADAGRSAPKFKLPDLSKVKRNDDAW